MKFGEMLKARRIKRKITLRQFAQDRFVSPGNLSRVERGNRLPCWRNLAWWIREYDVPAEKAQLCYLVELAERLRAGE